ncbi:MAG: tetratricopeptide repeat protein [Armatimonadetes bacterium]|nr:tetratricopeptide repeat protein [Armatimonadota bacterium]
MRTLTRLVAWAFACVGALVVLGGCSDKEIEETIGKQTAAAIESSYRVVDDPLMSDYIDTMGHILVGHSKRQDIPYEFKVIDTDIVNAAAVPWGYVYLTTGLLDFVDSEDELWAITGHELGHQVGRDSVRAVKENILLSLATILIGRQTRLGGNIADVGSDLLQLKHSRQDETQADDYSNAVIYAVGYDPAAQTHFFQRLMDEIEKDHPSRLETLFLTHPPTKDRIERQSAKPEVVQGDAKALAQVGAGYARRARYAEAIQRLSKAVELDGDNVATRLLLANCYLVRGERTEAGEEYAAVLKLDPGLLSAQEGLQAAQAPPPPEAAGSGEATTAAKSAVTQASAELAVAGEAVAAATQNLPRQLRPTAEAMQRSTDTLVGVGSRVPQLPPAAREVTVTTGLAIADASESLYCLERLSQLLSATVTSGKRMAEAAQGLGPGALDARQAAVLARAGEQLGKCATEVQALAGGIPDLVKTVQNAGRVAEGAANRVGDALLPGSTLAERQIAFDSVKLSQQRGEKTRDKTREAALRAAQARARSLVAEIDTAGIVLGAARADACDNLVAYYTQTDPTRARAFRQDHALGLGEAALLLAAAKSAQRPVDSLLELAGDDLDVVETARQADAHLPNVNFFLQFIADALAKEAAS